MFSASKTSGPSGYNLTNSLRFRQSANGYLSRTPASASNRRTWTWSGWVKLGTLGTDRVLFSAGSGAADSIIYLDSTNQIRFNTNNASNIVTTQVFRDPSAWYHIVGVLDTTQATAANRVKLYINGTLTNTATSAPTQNTDGGINNNIQHLVGGYASSPSVISYDGYMTEINFVDGQALTPSSFGSTNATTGVWQPARYSGSYGTNGFYLNFNSIALTSGSNTGLGKDNSGNGNYWNTNNISVTAGVTYDAMIDSPTNTSATVANYAVLNTVYKANSQPTISNANLTQTPTTTTYQNAFSTIGVTSGKWYVEITMAGTPNSANYFGIANATQLNYLVTNVDIPGTTTGTGYVYVALNGQKYTNGAGTAYGAALASGDVLGIAFDADAGTLTFYKNGVSQGTAFTGIDATTTFFFGGTVYSGGVTSVSYNFGQRPFTYTAPSGYVALNTYNLPDSTIKKGNTVMDATTFTATSGAQSITNAGAFKPDLVWVKARVPQNHYWVDSVRGGTSLLQGNITNAEAIYSTPNWISSFNSNGFSTDTASLVTNAYAYVAWQWQAGQGSTSSNTSGTITSTVSVNATAGFSVVTWAGSGAAGTVGHGLGVTPAMIITKNRTSGSTEWVTWHKSLPSATATDAAYIYLNYTAAASTTSIFYNGTQISSSVFGLRGNNINVNASSNNYVAYCWAEIAGFSKFGSYTGNGSADGPFVYTGFRPKYVLIKRTDGINAWYVLDSVRNTYNAMNSYIEPQDSAAEATFTFWDFLSNGFKLRQTASGINGSGQTIIYMAFAENPFKNALAR